MKIARLYSLSDIRIEDMPVPCPGPREALLRTRACGICSGDIMPWYIEKKAPLVPGHEIAGEIAETGSEVSSFLPDMKPGLRVAVHHHAPCFSCFFCSRFDFVQCATWKASSVFPGGLSEYILIPEVILRHDTLPLPDNVSFDDGTLVEPTACVVKSLKRARMRRGDTLLVLGLGVMGMLHILLAETFGAGTVIGADYVPYRLGKALELGADSVIDASEGDVAERLSNLTGGRGASIVIVGPNSAAAMNQGIGLAAPGGTVVLFTPAKPGEILEITPNDLYFRDMTVTTSYSCGPDDTREALGFIEKGIVTAAKLVTRKFPVTGAAEAFRITAKAENSLKCLVEFRS